MNWFHEDMDPGMGAVTIARTSEEEFMNCRTGSCKTLSIIFALLAMAIMATPAFAGNCLKDVSRANSCTANDVSVAAVLGSSVDVYQGGIVGTNQCIEKGKFSFTADFEVKTTSSSTRSNIGIFFGTGQNSALSGTCSNAILAPNHPCAYIPDPANPGSFISTATCGDANYSEKDQAINGEPGSEATQASCGDTASGDSSIFGPGTHAATLDVVGVTCPAAGTTCPAGSGINGPCLQLPVCTSWYQPANGMPVCESPTETAPTDSYPWVAAAIPGAPSKCTCGTIFVPVIPVTVTPKVAKACTTTGSTPNPPTFDFSGTTGSGMPNSCDAGAEGSQVTYTVAIKSTATLANNDTVVDQVCDNVYGNIFTAAGFSGAACPKGATGYDGTAHNVDCPPGGTTGIAPGATAMCTFTATVGENLTGLIDTVSASGHSSLDSSSTFINTQSNSVTVTSSDAPSSETTTKSLDSLVHGCATLRLAVDVHNSGGADEVLTLSALTDSVVGDVTEWTGSTPANAKVFGTTCGVANGVGTLAGSTGAGTLPASIAVGGDYSCKFDAQICGDLTTITVPGGTCLGLTDVDTVTPTLAGDENAGEHVSHTDSTLTENVCFTHIP